MKKFLIVLVLMLMVGIGSYASVKPSPRIAHIDDKSLKLTINLGNITKFSDQDIDSKVKAYTSNFLANGDAVNYNIIIKATTDPKPIKDLKIESMSFQVEIKGTLTEVKKELKTIAKVINEMKNSGD